MNYTLDFQNLWGHRQLVRKGGERSPLERELRIAKQDQYGNIVYDPNMVVPETYDFVVSTVTGNIIPNLSSGKRGEIQSICLLPKFVDETISASRL